jgi:intein-encoded DNA endonuclease-like protein
MRVRANERAKELRADGMSYNKIAETLLRETGFKTSKGQISEWLREIHSPLGSANYFSPEPSPELAYVIGVELGDGSITRKGYNRRIRLSAIDLDFVMEFDRCLSKILGTRTHTPWFDKRRGDFSIEARSVLLYEFLNRDWKRFKLFIKHCPDCMGRFLRGFFDSEGSITGRKLTCWNSNLPLLRYVRRLLSSLGIGTTGPHLQKEAGSEISNRGRTYLRRRDCYEVYVRTTSLSEFNRLVGFAIKRKQERLQAALRPTALGRY